MSHSNSAGNLPERTFDVPPEHIVRSSRGKDWNGFDIAEIVHPHDDFALPAIPRHVLVVHLGPAAEATERLAGRQGHLEPGSLAILPAGAPSTWHLDPQGEVRHLHLYLPPALIEKVAAAADVYPDTVELIDTIGAHDPHVEAIALSLLSELRSEGLGGRLYVESLTTLLAVHLLRRHVSATRLAAPRRAGLSKAALRQVLAYVEDQLADDLALADLAAVAGLSVYHFARRFKEALGVAPHQYLIQRRIERAKRLLATTNWPLAAIAHAVGFASASHLALHFRRLTGLTPKQFR